MPTAALPTGTVTFLRTDVEGSMRLARSLGSGWDDLNAVQLGAIRAIVGAEGGTVVRTEGDAVFAAFSDALDAVHAAIAIQRALDGHPWPKDAAVLVRIGLHTGEAHLAGDDYGGFDVNRAARIAAVAHGGQVVLSDPTRALVAPRLPDDVAIRDLGEHALRDVPHPERLFQLTVPGLRAEFPPLRAAAPTRADLPTRLTSFVGRDADLRELEGLLGPSRLVTITGPGGIGKTSVAVEAARRVAHRFPDGVWFVPFAAVADPALVPITIASTLGLFGGAAHESLDGLTAYLAPRGILLVLDNLEHLLGAAGAIASLLQAAPQLSIVATSRAPLRIRGEQEYPLEPLALPPDPEAASADAPAAADASAGDDQPASVRLFVERARAARPGWSPGTDAAVVADICRRLDGLPLGIELAAARVALLPPAVLRDRLAAHLPLPGPAPRDVPDRHMTLEHAIGWSYELLDEPHRRLLRELAVFEGGFDLDQVRRVASDPVAGGDAIDGLVALADQSLIERESAAVSDLATVRFRLLETVRAFAAARLDESGDAAAVRERHAQAFLALAEQARRHLPGADQPRWIDRLAEDDGNLRAAVDHALATSDVRLAHRLAAALWRYWQLDGRLHVARRATEAILAMPGADEPTPELAWFLGAAGSIAYWQADTERAHELYGQQRAVARAVGDRAAEADACFNLSATTFMTVGRDEAAAVLAEARALFEALGDEVGLARVAWSESNLLVGQRDPDELLAFMRDLLERFRRNGDPMYEALAIGNIAWVNFMAGRIVAAARAALESVTRHTALRDRATTILTLQEGAIGLLDLGRPEEAAELMGAWAELCRVHGVKPPGGLALMIMLRDPERRLAEALPPDVHEAALARGRRMGLDEAVSYMIEQFGAAVADAERDAQ